MCECLLMRERYGGRLEVEQMKFVKQAVYSFDMTEYDIEVNFHADKDVSGDDSRFNGDFCNEMDDNVEENLGLTDEDDDLYRQLAQKEKDLLLAAELGKALLEKNEELGQKYEMLQEEYSQAVEELEQDKYELKLKLERLQDSHEARVQELQGDLQSLRNELKILQSTSKTDQQSKRETFAGLTEENEQLHSDLQKVKTENHQLKRDLGLLKKQVNRKISFDDEGLQEIEIEELYEKLERLEEEKNSLTQTVTDLVASKEALVKEVDELLAKNQLIEKNLASSKGQLAHCEEELNESKDHNAFLQEQIDEIKMQASMDQLSRTSLFSEISDLSAVGLADELERQDDKLATASPRGVPELRSVPSLHGTPKPLMASSSLGLGQNSNKRHRPYTSTSDDENSDSYLEYDEEEPSDRHVLRNINFYEQLEEEEKTNAQLKKEICDAHNELLALYEELRSSHEGLDALETAEMDPGSDIQPGQLTSFLMSFRDVLETIVRDNTTRSTSLKQQLCKAHENIDSLKGELLTVISNSKEYEEEINDLKEKLNEQRTEIKNITEQRNKLAEGECASELAFDVMYNEAVKDRQHAIEREKKIARELKKSKENSDELDQQLKEAIQQKIKLSKQLEDWQFDMAALIEEQVQKEMQTVAKEQDDSRNRKKLSPIPRRWNWNSNNRRHSLFQ